jgi:hypothetical protein
LAIHRDAAGEWNQGELQLETIISLKIFDRNSQVRFHKTMAVIGMHGR